ncbi:MAG: hypothetical protein ACRELB_00990, partial [Polyangiaceae bacterium]
HALGKLAGVAALTNTARARNRSRAARGMHEPIEATVRWLAAATSPDGRTTYADVEREAVENLRDARSRYALARQRPCA